MHTFEIGDIVRILGPRDKESLEIESEAVAVGLIGKIVGIEQSLIYVEFDVYNKCWEDKIEDGEGYNSGFVYYFFPDEIERYFENEIININVGNILDLI